MGLASRRRTARTPGGLVEGEAEPNATIGGLGPLPAPCRWTSLPVAAQGGQGAPALNRPRGRLHPPLPPNDQRVRIPIGGEPLSLTVGTTRCYLGNP